MASFYDFISQYIIPYKTQLIVAFVVIVFCVVAYNYIKEYDKPEDATLKQVHQPSNVNEATVHFFTADWCPHCKAVKTVIADFTNEYDGKVIKNTKIHVIQHDCTDPKKEPAKTDMKNFGVDSFPTVKMQTNGSTGNSTYDFDAKITKENLENFLAKVL